MRWPDRSDWHKVSVFPNIPLNSLPTLLFIISKSWMRAKKSVAPFRWISTPLNSIIYSMLGIFQSSSSSCINHITTQSCCCLQTRKVSKRHLERQNLLGSEVMLLWLLNIYIAIADFAKFVTTVGLQIRTTQYGVFLKCCWRVALPQLLPLVEAVYSRFSLR